MLAVSLTPESEQALKRLNEMLPKYMEASKRTLDQMLDHKGNDLGQALYNEFRNRAWGGPGKNPGLAQREFSARRAERGRATGGGINLRPELKAIYTTERASLTKQIRSAGQRMRRSRGTLNDWISLRDASAKVRELRASLWQRLVRSELEIRQMSRMALAASFLWFRKRRSNARGTYIVPNKSGGALGKVDRGDNYLRIVGYTDGLATMDHKYGVVTSAINTVIADTAIYMAKHLDEDFKTAARERGFLK